MLDSIKGSRTRALRFSGFTLIELLVVIAIIALLISIVLPGMAEARRLAYRVREMAAGEQKMIAYTQYAADNKDAQFVGYAPWSVAHLGNAGGQFSYVLLHPDILWGGNYHVEGNTIKMNGMRFAGATSMNLEALMIDKPTFSSFNNRSMAYSTQNPTYSPPTNLYDSTTADKAAAISFHPTLGLNTTFLGGSAHRGAFNVANASTKWAFRQPGLRQHYTTTTSQLNFPSRILVMGSARGVDISTTGTYGSTTYGTQSPTWGLNSPVVPGWWEIIPPVGGYPMGGGAPNAGTVAWTAAAANNTWNKNTDPATWGYMDMRHKNQAVTVMGDGHVEMLGLKDLRDMKRWKN